MTSELVWRSLTTAAVRLWRAPTYAATLGIAFGLGVGVTLAMSSIVYAVLLLPPPFPSPSELIVFSHSADGRGPSYPGLPLNTYLAARDAVGGMSGIGAFIPDRQDTVVTLGGKHEIVSTTSITPELFPVLGIRPISGRWASGYGEVVVSTGMWRRIVGDQTSFRETAIVVEGGEQFLVV
jgi:hypothetical protein